MHVVLSRKKRTPKRTPAAHAHDSAHAEAVLATEFLAPAEPPERYAEHGCEAENKQSEEVRLRFIGGLTIRRDGESHTDNNNPREQDGHPEGGELPPVEVMDSVLLRHRHLTREETATDIVP